MVAVGVPDAGLASAYRKCERIARDHAENFPVASILLPAEMRPHVAAVYAFARTADDFADEGSLSIDQRLALLDGWAERLHSACRSPDRQAPPVAAEPLDTPDLFRALGASIQRCNLPVALFEDLVSAFRQDVLVKRYEQWSDVLDYCRRSANPVGRLVLRISGRDDSACDRRSDLVCSALQLTNFWQDFWEDYSRGRIYLPREEWRKWGASESDLAAGALSESWRDVMEAASARTREMYLEGRSLCDEFDGRIKWELRATWLGGMRILERLDTQGIGTAADRPSLGVADACRIGFRALAWQAS